MTITQTVLELTDAGQKWYVVDVVDASQYLTFCILSRDGQLDSEEPLLERRTVVTRPRSRSKPDGIFIHPNQSNVARADALASEMGLAGSTDCGKNYEREEDAWSTAEGKETARTLLRSSRKPADDPFQLRSHSDSDSD